SEACYRYVCEREPARADRAYEWAFALERLGLIEESIAQYERAARLGHEQPEACWYMIGRNHLRREDAALAREAFAKAEDLPGARYEIARLLARDPDRAGALALLDRLNAVDPRAAQPWQLRHRLEALADGPGFAWTADRAAQAPGRLLTPFDRECER